jgi:phosphate transport system substrate-binding protein
MKRFAMLACLSLFLTFVSFFPEGISWGADSEIIVVSREDGSGTRGAFIELFGVLRENVDRTAATAEITNNTAVMMTSIAGDANAIGYISLGSMNDTVKAVKIDGTDATADNIKNGSYKISRPFIVATKGDVSAAAKAFIGFIMSREGQDIAAAGGYIKINEGSPFSGGKPQGRVVVAGSSSVTPLMEKLAEAYKKVNANTEIEIQQSDSSTGMNAVIDGVCDIGMSSRELKDSEKEKGLAPSVIAMDGIAVIVNKSNPVTNMTKDQVMKIFTGEITGWSGVK